MGVVAKKSLDVCTREQLVKIADHFNVGVGDKWVKDSIRANLEVNLFEQKGLGVCRLMCLITNQYLYQHLWAKELNKYIGKKKQKKTKTQILILRGYSSAFIMPK